MSFKRRLILVMLLPAALVLTAELLVRLAWITPEQRRAGAARLWATYQRPPYYPMNETDGCTWIDSLLHHPYLGYTHHLGPRCQVQGVDAFGFRNANEFPRERDGEFFSILLLGGEFSGQLAGQGRPGPGWLERELNAEYRSPDGRRFRVFGAALEGWSMPIPSILITLVGASFDGIVSIDGYEEALRIAAGKKLTSPDPDIYLSLVNPQFADPVLLKLRRLQWIRREAFSWWLTRNSFLAYLSFERAAGRATEPTRLRKAQEEVLGRYFDFLSPKTESEKWEWNRKKYESSIRMEMAQAEVVGAKYAHFLQPLHRVHRGPPPEEEAGRLRVISDKLYEAVLKGTVTKLHKAGLPVFSLPEDIAVPDHPMTAASGDTPGSPRGVVQLASDLARTWKLRKRSSRAKSPPS